MSEKPKIKIKPEVSGNVEPIKKPHQKKTRTVQSPFSPKSHNNYMVVKTSLKSILKNYEHNFPIIDKLVIDCHEIVETTYKFMRLYILHCYHHANGNINLLPTFDKDFVLQIIRVCGFHDPRGAKPKDQELGQKLNNFYEQEFKPCFNKEKYDLTRKTDLLTYLANQIQTGFNNNIKEHFITHIRRFMNLLRPTQLKDDRIFAKIKNYILSDQHELIPEEFRSWSLNINSEFLPPVREQCYGYDVKLHPEKYVYYLIKMTQKIEEINQQITQSQLSEEEKQKKIHKLFQSIPLRTSKIPCYLTFDATSILTIFFEKGKALLRKKISSHQEEIWGTVFDLDKKVLKKKGYHFESIQTDGIGVSICYQKNGLSYAEKKTKREKCDPMYLDELNNIDLAKCQNRKIVTADPGKQSSVYLMNDQKKKLRYTPRQRKAESKADMCQMIMESEKESDKIHEEEALLSKYNRKTVNYQQFKEYIQAETLYDQRIGGFYQQPVWRKMKWRIWINRRRSEDQFLNRIERTFGSPDEILICYGDWSSPKQMKYLMPSQGVGLRRLIEKKYDVVMMNEFRTSKLCNQCHNELDHHKNLYRVLVCRHCQSNRLESKCCYFNRDANACMNMMYLAHEWLVHKRRPEAYSRSTINTNDHRLTTVTTRVENPWSS